MDGDSEAEVESDDNADTCENDLVPKAYMYITDRTYPAGATANVIRNKSKKFAVRNGEIFYRIVTRGQSKYSSRWFASNGMYTSCPQSSIEVTYIRNKEEEQQILKACHLDLLTSGHMGFKRTIRRITERYIWPAVARDVCDYMYESHKTKC